MATDGHIVMTRPPLSGGDVAGEGDAGSSGSGRVRLRPNRGLHRVASPCNVTPHDKLSLELFDATRPRASHSRVANSFEIDGRIVIDSNHPLLGVMSQAKVTRQAPAQAELRPTCAGGLPAWLGLATSPYTTNYRSNYWMPPDQGRHIIGSRILYLTMAKAGPS